LVLWSKITWLDLTIYPVLCILTSLDKNDNIFFCVKSLPEAVAAGEGLVSLATKSVKGTLALCGGFKDILLLHIDPIIQACVVYLPVAM